MVTRGATPEPDPSYAPVPGGGEFDAYGATYGEHVQRSIDFSGLQHTFFLQAKADRIQAVVARTFGSGVHPLLLDVGCGVGALHPYLTGTFRKICGVDISEASLAYARKNMPMLEYLHYDGHRIPYDDQTFDFVSAVCVLHHVPPAQWGGFVGELRRVVNRGGVVCIVEHNPLNPLTRLAVSRCPFDADAVFLRARTTERLLSGAGLHNVSTEFFLLFPSAARIVRRLECAVNRLPLGAQYMTCGRA
jgi:SAM-dependent methyltransferase